MQTFAMGGTHEQPTAPGAKATEIISDLHRLITAITRKSHDGRIEPYCGGNCGFICDLRDIVNFGVIDRAIEYLTRCPATSRDQLRDRIADICCGACGRFVGDEDEILAVEELSRVIPAIQATWPGLPDWVWFPHNLGHFASVDSITDFIYGAMQE